MSQQNPIPDTILTDFIDACRQEGFALNPPCLDVGCANGKNFPLLPRPLGGLDIRVPLVQEARQAHSGPDVLCLAAALPHLPFPDGSFESAVCWGVLYILGGPTQVVLALREIGRVLRPCGLLFTSYRTTDCVMTRFAGEPLAEGTFRINEDAPPAQRGLVMSFWSEDRIREMHREAGLEVLSLRDLPREDKLGRHHFLGFVAQRPA